MRYRSRAKLFALLLVVSAAWSLAAQELSVSYLDGKVSQKNGFSWQELSIGDAISADATLRVEAHTYVEFSTGSARITLSQPGTYIVKSLVSASRSLHSAGAGEALNAMLSALVSGRSQNQTSVGGVRAGDKSKDQDSGYFSSDADIFLKSGKDYIGSGQYDKAIEELKQAKEAAEESERGEVRYYLAEAYSLNGETRSAFAQIVELQPENSAAWLPDFILLKGKILIDVSAYDQSAKWLAEKGAGLAMDAQRMQTYFFLMGLAYKGTGEIEKERQSFTRVISAGGDSELGKAAAKLMQER
jgi:tetratricopeptide (TPR) repeat protein